MRFLLVLICLFCLKCKVDSPSVSFKTRNLVIVIMDGARWSETFGEPAMQYIPSIGSLLPSGTYATSFYNNGVTRTTNGHTAITTGVYQEIDNGGQELPDHPGIFQLWIKQMKKDNSKAWIIATKDKLEVLKSCKDPLWQNLYVPRTDCGINGLGTGYRDDSTTYRKAIEILSEYHPPLTLINFKNPDAAGHSAIWSAYLNGIRSVDQYTGALWSFIQSDPHYNGTTTMIVTNDHGRHLDNVLDGFVSHGDDCEGCKHVMLFVIGPDTPKGKVISDTYGMTDLHASIISLMGIDNPVSSGRIIPGLFE